MLCVLVNIRFQVLFHSPPGVLFTFPSQYCSTIGHQVVFRLGGWSPHLPIGFHVPDGTLDTVCRSSLRLQDSHLLWLAFPHHSAWLDNTYDGPNPDGITTIGLASSAFARHYSRNLGWFLFLPVLRCFSSRGSPHTPMYSVYDIWFFTICVSTFGNLRIKAYLQLPAAYRSLSRPSSALDAKAFTLCSFLLELPISVLTFLELLEFQNMGFIFSHLKGFPFSALFVFHHTVKL